MEDSLNLPSGFFVAKKVIGLIWNIHKSITHYRIVVRSEL